MANPLPASDLIDVAATGPYTMAASALLGNDIDLQGGALSITSVLNPVGGTVTLSGTNRSEEHTSELQSLMRISYAVFCLKKKNNNNNTKANHTTRSRETQDTTPTYYH